MKITQITSSLYRWPRPTIANGAHVYRDGELLLLEVHTDQGPYGTAWIGGTAAQRPLKLFVPFVAFYESLLRGLDPMDPEARTRMHQLTDGDVKTFGSAGPHSQVSAMIHNALYDLRGKVANKPVHALLGTKRRRVRRYIAGGYYQSSDTLEGLQRELSYNVKELCAHGVKIKIGNPAVGLNEDVRRVSAAREAIGPETALMLDANCAFSLSKSPYETALAYADAFAPYNIYWLEEPFDPAEIPLHAELAASSPIPIATGENVYTTGHFEMLLQREIATFLNADVAIMGGGYDACMEVVALACTYNAVIAPHGCQELQIHLLMAADERENSGWLEVYPNKVDPQRDEIFPRSINVDMNGYALAPTLPGIGFTPCLEALKKFRVLPH